MLPVKNKIVSKGITEKDSTVPLGSDTVTPVVVDDISSSQSQQPSMNDLKGAISDLEYFYKSSKLDASKFKLQMKKKEMKFKEKISSVLDKLDVCEVDMNDLFLCVLQSAEDYFIDVDEPTKTQICVDLLDKYTNNEMLCRQMIKAISKQVKPSTMWRRNKKAIFKLFFWLWEGFVKTN